MKSFTISFDNLVLNNKKIVSESLNISHSLSTEDNLVFGLCESSKLTVEVEASTVNTDMIGSLFTLKENGVNKGIWRIKSIGLSGDGHTAKIEAYDRMNDLVANMADWYKQILPENDSTVTLKQFRDSLFAHIGMVQESVQLVNDTMIVRKTIDTNQIGGIEIVQAICELNGVMGHIDDDGTFRYINLKNTPLINIGKMQELNYEKYTVKSINRLQIQMESGDIGWVSPEVANENCYIVTDNFLTYGMSTEEMQAVGQKLLPQINGITYVPFTATFRNNDVSIGSRVNLDGIESVILNLEISGGQSLKYTASASGNEYRSEDIDGLNYEFKQLKGKANYLTRTVEGTVSRVVDLESEINGEGGIATQIEQLAGKIVTTVEIGGEVVSRFSQDLGRFLFEGDCFEIKTNNVQIDGTTFIVDNGYIGNLKIGSEGLSSEDYTTWYIHKDGSAQLVNLSVNGKGQIYLKPAKDTRDEDVIIPYFKTKNGFLADYNGNNTAMLYAGNDGAVLTNHAGDSEDRTKGSVNLVIRDDAAYVEDDKGVLLPLYSSNPSGTYIANNTMISSDMSIVENIGLPEYPLSTSTATYTTPADGLLYVYADKQTTGMTLIIEVQLKDGSWYGVVRFPNYSQYGESGILIPFKRNTVIRFRTDSAANSWHVRHQRYMYTNVSDPAVINDDYEKLKNLPVFNGRTLLGTVNESDPTVPEWAKSSNKPIYTAGEVGAVPTNEAIGRDRMLELWNSVFEEG